MKLEELDKIIEGILFVNCNPVAISDIKEKLELQKSEINDAVAKLEKKYAPGKSGVVLLKFGGKLQFATNPKYVDAIASVLNPIKEKELSRACLETLAIIAYRQPITRLEIEDVRGVSSDYTVQVLEKNGLIEVVGRKDALGKPLLFGTTDEFLKRFQLENLEQLPDYEELLARLHLIETPAKKEDLTEGDTLYNHFDVPVMQNGETAEADIQLLQNENDEAAATAEAASDVKPSRSAEE